MFRKPHRNFPMLEMEAQPQTLSMDAEGASSSRTQWKYHVFLSFRGEDTRKSFSDHLYAALQRMGILTFRDDKELERGGVIKQELLAAIENSLSAIVILSEKYASSTWCLDELLKILESKEKLSTQVFPIFYGVDPSDVRNQSASFAEAFKEHEKKFGENNDKVQKWRHALKEVGNLAGWHTENWHEAKLIEKIVETVWTKLKPKLPSYDTGLVGIKSKIEDFYSCLRLELHDVRFIGIWGMGGIGKTTLATAVFNNIKSQFDTTCFQADIREVCEKGHGLVHLQNKLLSQLKLKSLEIESLYEGKDTIRNLLCCKKVLLVLDDISDESQLENLAGNMDWFGPGSRVILTTRDMHLLTSNQIFETYKIKILKEDESLQLLCQKAFKSGQPPEQFLELSKQVIQYAGGLPLALKVLGSFLRGRDESQWEQILFKIEKVPKGEIINKLKISYDGLESEYQTIFLDIACFFKGWSKHRVIEILENCNRYTLIGIDILVERSLITCGGGILGMHDLLQELGRRVVFEQSLNDAGKRSRLWSLKDIDQVLEHNKGSDLIEGISLQSPTEVYDAHWHPEAFSKMSKLKLLLILWDLQLPLGLKCFPSSLQVLHWKGYPLEALPLGQLDAIVDLKMHHSKIKRLWNGTHVFEKLKFVDLSHSKDLVDTPIFSEVPNLERLVLEGCRKLVKVHQSIGQHKNLIILNLKDCINLKSLPSKLEMSCLNEFILSGCLKIEKLPEFGENMKSLTELYLEDCKNLVCLPKSICNLISLRILHIKGCLKISELPCNMDQNVVLEELNVSRTAVRELTSSNICLENLKGLSFGVCEQPSSWCSFFKKLLIPVGWATPPFLRLSSLKQLDLPFSRLSSLKHLDLSDSNLIDGSIPDDLSGLRSLRFLDLSGNKFASLPTHCIASIPGLREFSLNNCASLQSLPMLPGDVKEFSAVGCARIENSMLDLQEFLRLLESMEDWSHIFSKSVLISGSEIPRWFGNPKHYHLREVHGDIEHIVEVDVPDHCYSSEWGIAICLAVKPARDSKVLCFWIKVSLISEPLNYPNSRIDIKAQNKPLIITSRGPAFSLSNNVLYIEFLRVENKYVQGHLRGRQGQIKCTVTDFDTKRQIKKVGCRVICKEDVERVCKVMMNEFGMLLNSSIGGNKSKAVLTEIANEKRGRDEFEESKDVTNTNVADEANPPHHSKRRRLQ